MENKKILPILAIGIILILAIIIGGYFWNESIQDNQEIQVFKTQTECEKATGMFCAEGHCDLNCPENKYWRGWVPVGRKIENNENDISNWQTYRNEKYGFEIKIPQSFSVFDDYPSKEQFFISSNRVGEIRSPIDGLMFFENSETVEISMDKLKKRDELTEVLEEETVIINGITIKIIILTAAIGYNDAHYFFEKDNKNFEVIFDSENEVYKKILSTFKFINKTETLCGNISIELSLEQCKNNENCRIVEVPACPMCPASSYKCENITSEYIEQNRKNKLLCEQSNGEWNVNELKQEYCFCQSPLVFREDRGCISIEDVE